MERDDEAKTDDCPDDEAEAKPAPKVVYGKAHIDLSVIAKDPS